MPGGRRNPLSMSSVLESLGDVAHTVKHLQSSVSKTRTKARASAETAILANTSYVDLEIQFIGASGLPKMDVVGLADPYFIAKIEGKVFFVSKVIRNTLSPVWNEYWRVKNVPATASLRVEVMDKDEGAMTDDFVGSFAVSVSAGAKEAEIAAGPGLRNWRRDRGTFWLKIDSTPSALPVSPEHLCVFDGPIRYSRHYSPTIGLLTTLEAPDTDNARLYSTWKITLRGVSLFFGDKYQHWNAKYKAARSIFGPGPACATVRSGIQAGHRMLYARTAENGFGIVSSKEDVFALLYGSTKNKTHDGKVEKRIKPAVYTYIISAEDDSLRFSETGAKFFVDFASKHALHANCARSVRYSGEFHPRPVILNGTDMSNVNGEPYNNPGWTAFTESIPDDSVDWELVVDNNSGTYAPDAALLPVLKACLEYNFPGVRIVTYDREDKRLQESVKGCRDYAVHVRGVAQEDLQPQISSGEATLLQKASVKRRTGFGKQHGGNEDGYTYGQVPLRSDQEPETGDFASDDLTQGLLDPLGHDTAGSELSSSLPYRVFDPPPPLPLRPILNPNDDALNPLSGYEQDYNHSPPAPQRSIATYVSTATTSTDGDRLYTENIHVNVTSQEAPSSLADRSSSVPAEVFPEPTRYIPTGDPALNKFEFTPLQNVQYSYATDRDIFAAAPAATTTSL